ncbi:MAG: S-layer homology domain-containing protein [Nitriliruptor sp.]|uniref:S-layer homology domain-containing protein n=1 Tax=Nitriliruptor sp. TaxID=2448056 RepID=UPI0034A05847
MEARQGIGRREQLGPVELAGHRGAFHVGVEHHRQEPGEHIEQRTLPLEFLAVDLRVDPAQGPEQLPVARIADRDPDVLMAPTVQAPPRAVRAPRDGGGGGQVSVLEAHVIPFRDVPLSHTHAPAIAALLARGDVRGCATTAFCPDRSVTRGQFATLLTRVAGLPAGEPTRFRDVDGTHRPGIEAVTSAGITRGCSQTRYCPVADVSRGQLATFLQEALRLPDAPAPFTDVPAGSTHAGAIGALSARGLVVGDADGRFRPNDPVSRGQTATILHRAYAR